MTPALGYGAHLEQWLTGSPSSTIRACSNLASNYMHLAFSLFKVAFYSCWRNISPDGRKQISETFLSILASNENYEAVAKEILELIFFMMKMNPPMVIPRQEIAKACLNYGYDDFALCLQQNEIFSEKTIGMKTVLQLIDTFIAIGEWNNAHAIWKHYSSSMPAINRPEAVAKLRLWDKVMPIYQEKFIRGNTDAFTGLIKSLSSMAK